MERLRNRDEYRPDGFGEGLVGALMFLVFFLLSFWYALLWALLPNPVEIVKRVKRKDWSTRWFYVPSSSYVGGFCSGLVVFPLLWAFASYWLDELFF